MRTPKSVDAFGPGFIPGKVVTTRDAPSRALQRRGAAMPDEQLANSFAESASEASSGDADDQGGSYGA